MKRSFLFLQGVCSPFFARLADRLRAHGHWVHKINFNGGDIAYWGGSHPSTTYRGSLDELASFYRQKFNALHATDIVLFGDRRPVHQPAASVARELGIRIHVYEEGYFRPYWVTLERDGVNGHSRLPKDPLWYKAVSGQVPHYDNGEMFRSSFAVRACHDVAYQSCSLINPIFFPKYRSHALDHPFIEYAGYIRRAARLIGREKRDFATIKRLIEQATPFFFLPLQLNSDAQIRDHSSFKSMVEALRHILESFTREAPSHYSLVVKNHPLDCGLIDYQELLAREAASHGVEDRIIYLETGHLPSILEHAAGVVTVNSTVGSSALIHGRPTIALSNPIYNMAGLTFQGELDDFWRSPEPPDQDLFTKFRNVVIHSSQVNGGFYSSEGISMAVNNSMRILEAEQAPIDRLLS